MDDGSNWVLLLLPFLPFLAFSFFSTFISPITFPLSLCIKVVFAFLKLTLSAIFLCLLHLSLQAEIMHSLRSLSGDSKPWWSLLPMKCQILLFAPIFTCKTSLATIFQLFTFLCAFLLLVCKAFKDKTHIFL